jgi:hypothetical protein
MKKTALLMATLIFTAGLAAAAPIFEYTFTTSDHSGWTDGAKVSAYNMWSAQNPWTITNAATTGEAILATDWARAETFHNYTAAVGETVRVVTEFAVDGTLSGNGKLFTSIGFAEKSQTTGNAIPDVRALLESATDGSYTIGDGAANVVTIGATDANDWMRFTIDFTRSTTANEYNVELSVFNITDDALVGSTTFDSISTLSSWGDATELQTGFRGHELGNAGADAVRIGYLSTEVIPEPATLGLITAAGGAVLFIRRRFMI